MAHAILTLHDNTGFTAPQRHDEICWWTAQPRTADPRRDTLSPARGIATAIIAGSGAWALILAPWLV